MSVLTSRRREYEGLAKRMKKGEESARQAFVEVFSERLRRFFERNGLAGAYAEDLAVNCVGEIILRIDRYRPRKTGGFEAWCFAVARNLMRDWWRWRLRRRVRILPNGLAAPASPTDDRPEPRINAIVRKEMNALSDIDREILTLRVTSEEDGFVEIAKHLGIRTGTARVRFHRARQRLKDRLALISMVQDWLRNADGMDARHRKEPRAHGSRNEQPRQAVR